MKQFLIALTFALLTGCGANLGYNPLDGAPDKVDNGVMPVEFVVVAYSDTPAPAYQPGDIANLGQHLDAVIQRNSAGKNSVAFTAINVTLPKTQAEYVATNYVDQVGQPPSGDLEIDCLNAAPSTFYGRPFRIFLTPAVPPIYLGFAAIAAGWCSSNGGDILAIPVAHEFGHTLGMEHDPSPGFIMFPANTVDWNQDYSAASKQRAGWQ